VRKYPTYSNKEIKQMRLYSVYDVKANHYGNPIAIENDQVAKRMFTKAVNQPGTEWNDHPEDFIMYRVAHFDAERGQIMECPLIAIATASEVKVNPIAQPIRTEEN